MRLARGFGGMLREQRARAHLTQRELAEAAGLHVHTVELLEVGWRRPTSSSVWKLARALRPKGTLRDRVALDERLRRAAGSSLRYAATRAHRRREAVRAELLEEADGGVVLGDHDETLGGAIAAALAFGAVDQRID
jgi:transcriptional regulator with XRE-family HTH domain